MEIIKGIRKLYVIAGLTALVAQSASAVVIPPSSIIYNKSKCIGNPACLDQSINELIKANPQIFAAADLTKKQQHTFAGFTLVQVPKVQRRILANLQLYGAVHKAINNPGKYNYSTFGYAMASLSDAFLCGKYNCAVDSFAATYHSLGLSQEPANAKLNNLLVNELPLQYAFVDGPERVYPTSRVPQNPVIVKYSADIGNLILTLSAKNTAIAGYSYTAFKAVDNIAGFSFLKNRMINLEAQARYIKAISQNPLVASSINALMAYDKLSPKQVARLEKQFPGELEKLRRIENARTVADVNNNVILSTKFLKRLGAFPRSYENIVSRVAGFSGFSKNHKINLESQAHYIKAINQNPQVASSISALMAYDALSRAQVKNLEKQFPSELEKLRHIENSRTASDVNKNIILNSNFFKALGVVPSHASGITVNYFLNVATQVNNSKGISKLTKKNLITTIGTRGANDSQMKQIEKLLKTASSSPLAKKELVAISQIGGNNLLDASEKQGFISNIMKNPAKINNIVLYSKIYVKYFKPDLNSIRVVKPPAVVTNGTSTPATKKSANSKKTAPALVLLNAKGVYGTRVLSDLSLVYPKLFEQVAATAGAYNIGENSAEKLKLQGFFSQTPKLNSKSESYSSLEEYLPSIVKMASSYVAQKRTEVDNTTPAFFLAKDIINSPKLSKTQKKQYLGVLAKNPYNEITISAIFKYHFLVANSNTKKTIDTLYPKVAQILSRGYANPSKIQPVLLSPGALKALNVYPVSDTAQLLVKVNQAVKNYPGYDTTDKYHIEQALMTSPGGALLGETLNNAFALKNNAVKKIILNEIGTSIKLNKITKGYYFANQNKTTSANLIASQTGIKAAANAIQEATTYVTSLSANVCNKNCKKRMYRALYLNYPENALMASTLNGIKALPVSKQFKNLMLDSLTETPKVTSSAFGDGGYTYPGLAKVSSAVQIYTLYLDKSDKNHKSLLKFVLNNPKVAGIAASFATESDPNSPLLKFQNNFLAFIHSKKYTLKVGKKTYTANQIWSKPLSIAEPRATQQNATTFFNKLGGGLGDVLGGFATGLVKPFTAQAQPIWQRVLGIVSDVGLVVAPLDIGEEATADLALKFDLRMAAANIARLLDTGASDAGDIDGVTEEIGSTLDDGAAAAGEEGVAADAAGHVGDTGIQVAENEISEGEQVANTRLKKLLKSVDDMWTALREGKATGEISKADYKILLKTKGIKKFLLAMKLSGRTLKEGDEGLELATDSEFESDSLGDLSSGAGKNIYDSEKLAATIQEKNAAEFAKDESGFLKQFSKADRKSIRALLNETKTSRKVGEIEGDQVIDGKGKDGLPNKANPSSSTSTPQTPALDKPPPEPGDSNVEPPPSTTITGDSNTDEPLPEKEDVNDILDSFNKNSKKIEALKSEKEGVGSGDKVDTIDAQIDNLEKSQKGLVGKLNGRLKGEVLDGSLTDNQLDKILELNKSVANAVNDSIAEGVSELDKVNKDLDVIMNLKEFKNVPEWRSTLSEGAARLNKIDNDTISDADSKIKLLKEKKTEETIKFNKKVKRLKKIRFPGRPGFIRGLENKYDVAAELIDEQIKSENKLLEEKLNTNKKIISNDVSLTLNKQGFEKKTDPSGLFDDSFGKRKQGVLSRAARKAAKVQQRKAIREIIQDQLNTLTDGQGKKYGELLDQKKALETSIESNGMFIDMLKKSLSDAEVSIKNKLGTDHFQSYLDSGSNSDQHLEDQLERIQMAQKELPDFIAPDDEASPKPLQETDKAPPKSALKKKIPKGEEPPAARTGRGVTFAKEPGGVSSYPSSKSNFENLFNENGKTNNPLLSLDDANKVLADATGNDYSKLSDIDLSDVFPQYIDYLRNVQARQDVGGEVLKDLSSETTIYKSIDNISNDFAKETANITKDTQKLSDDESEILAKIRGKLSAKGIDDTKLEHYISSIKDELSDATDLGDPSIKGLYKKQPIDALPEDATVDDLSDSKKGDKQPIDTLLENPIVANLSDSEKGDLRGDLDSLEKNFAKRQELLDRAKKITNLNDEFMTIQKDAGTKIAEILGASLKDDTLFSEARSTLSTLGKSRAPIGERISAIQSSDDLIDRIKNLQDSLEKVKKDYVENTLLDDTDRSALTIHVNKLENYTRGVLDNIEIEKDTGFSHLIDNVSSQINSGDLSNENIRKFINAFSENEQSFNDTLKSVTDEQKEFKDAISSIKKSDKYKEISSKLDSATNNLKVESRNIEKIRAKTVDLINMRKEVIEDLNNFHLGKTSLTDENISYLKGRASDLDKEISANQESISKITDSLSYRDARLQVDRLKKESGNIELNGKSLKQYEISVSSNSDRISMLEKILKKSSDSIDRIISESDFDVKNVLPDYSNTGIVDKSVSDSQSIEDLNIAQKVDSSLRSVREGLKNNLDLLTGDLTADQKNERATDYVKLTNINSNIDKVSGYIERTGADFNNDTLSDIVPAVGGARDQAVAYVGLPGLIKDSDKITGELDTVEIERAKTAKKLNGLIDSFRSILGSNTKLKDLDILSGNKSKEELIEIAAELGKEQAKFAVDTYSNFTTAMAALRDGNTENILKKANDEFLKLKLKSESGDSDSLDELFSQMDSLNNKISDLQAQKASVSMRLNNINTESLIDFIKKAGPDKFLDTFKDFYKLKTGADIDPAQLKDLSDSAVDLRAVIINGNKALDGAHDEFNQAAKELGIINPEFITNKSSSVDLPSLFKYESSLTENIKKILKTNPTYLSGFTTLAAADNVQYTSYLKDKYKLKAVRKYIKKRVAYYGVKNKVNTLKQYEGALNKVLSSSPKDRQKNFSAFLKSPAFKEVKNTILTTGSHNSKANVVNLLEGKSKSNAPFASQLRKLIKGSKASAPTKIQGIPNIKSSAPQVKSGEKNLDSNE
jgi:uncharacterized protein YutD